MKLISIYITAFWVYLMFLPKLEGQNLIPNPSFEEQHCCPDSYSQFHCTKFWQRPSKGTSDFYSTCENRYHSPEVNVPTNFFGHEPANEGRAYVGIYAFYNDSYREYIQATLEKPLEKGQRYGISLKVSLADTAGIAIRSLGVSFSDTLVNEAHYFPLDRPFLLLQHDRSFLDNKKGWQELTLNYTAKGGERFILFGNFLNNFWTDTLSALTSSTAKIDRFTAYYYIDNTCIAPWKEDSTCACINQGEPPLVSRTYQELDSMESTNTMVPPKVGDRFVLKNIYFETAKSTLLPASFIELDRLYDLLTQYPSMEILISGHTDSRGGHRYNVSLSEARALSVYSYLIQKGISSGRLDFRGFGKTQPIATNVTEEGRQLNRRVEFEVVKIGVE